MLINIDEVATGVLVNVITSAGRLLTRPRTRRLAADLAIAQWFDTYELTGEGPRLPRLHDAARLELANILRSDEAQAVMQELLAARLTDAPEADVMQIRNTWELTFSQAYNVKLEVTRRLFEFYDERICDLVGRLEGIDPSPLRQIRTDAYNTRLIAILNAIERHTATLAARPDRRNVTNFLDRYRRQVRDQHGKLEPPDFERRRRVPLEDIYVNTDIHRENSAPMSSDIDLGTLASELDRTVLLGDPGSGKTTASKVLAHHFAGDEMQKVPFIITLRDFAVKHPPEHSVIGHIEKTLETFYQCPAPPGLIDLLMLTGRAIVIFDGLDELLETSRRVEVTTRVERFCTEYPLAPVLVTSRLVGYDQARLDDAQFVCYRLGGFRDSQVAEYATKWFALQEGTPPFEAEAFLTESASVRDLRTNPLLLSLMCILYRGEGSLPRDRSGVYQKCAELLFRKWDDRRRIHQELRAGHLVEPAVRHLAWWLFTRDKAQPTVTESQLIKETTKFLHGRGFETEDEAETAAREFVEFCRGRMWVLNDMGTSAAGERLYSFTHRTFLEYFSAAHLASVCDTPEELAKTLALRLSRNEWQVVGELGIQIKDQTSDQGADRVYSTLLKDLESRRTGDPDSMLTQGLAVSQESLLSFLVGCLRSVVPSPAVVRILTREVLRYFVEGKNPDSTQRWSLVSRLLRFGDEGKGVIADEIGNHIAVMFSSSDHSVRLEGLRLAMLPGYEMAFKFESSEHYTSPRQVDFWAKWASDQGRSHASVIHDEAETSGWIWIAALMARLISIDRILATQDGLRSLMFDSSQKRPQGMTSLAYLPYVFGEIFPAKSSLTFPGQALLAPGSAISEHLREYQQASARLDFTAVGQYLIKNPHPPWTFIRGGNHDAYKLEFHAEYLSKTFEEPTYLGIAVFIFSVFEAVGLDWWFSSRQLEPGSLGSLLPYLDSRRRMTSTRHRGSSDGMQIPELPVPAHFKVLLRNWAAAKVNFIASETGSTHASPPPGS